jgi:hypothetical protein
MLDRSQPSTAPADSELRICRPSVVPTRKQTSVRRIPEIKSMGAPSSRTNAHYWGCTIKRRLAAGLPFASQAIP